MSSFVATMSSLSDIEGLGVYPTWCNGFCRTSGGRLGVDGSSHSALICEVGWDALQVQHRPLVVERDSSNRLPRTSSAACAVCARLWFANDILLHFSAPLPQLRGHPNFATAGVAAMGDVEGLWTLEWYDTYCCAEWPGLPTTLSSRMQGTSYGTQHCQCAWPRFAQQHMALCTPLRVCAMPRS